MQKISTFLKTGMVAAMLLAFCGEASAKYPSISQLKDKTYSFKGTLVSQAGSVAKLQRFNALKEEFEFKFVDPYGFGTLAIADFILGINIPFEYNETTGQIKITGKQGAMSGIAGQSYFADANAPSGSAGLSYDFIWQMNDDGSISIPDFTIRDFADDIAFGKYTNITATTDAFEDEGGGDVGGGGDPTPSYPNSGVFTKKYKFNAERELLISSYDQQLATGFNFTITGSGSTISINELFGSSAGISGEYDQTTGLITIRSNTLRYGEIGAYDYLGITDIDGTWKGFGAQNVTCLPWSVDETGKITVPDFAVVDYSFGTKILAKFRNITLTVVDVEEEAKQASFEGVYRFAGTLKRTPVAGYHDEDDTILHSYIEFTINKYNQITSFNEYKDILLADGREGNYMYNRGDVKVNGDVATYRIDMETINYAQLQQPEYDSKGEPIPGTSFMKRFGSESTEWTQGREAFTLTRIGTQESGFDYTLTPLSLFERYGVEEGESIVYYDSQFALWKDIKYLGESPIIISSEHGCEFFSDSREVVFTCNVEGNRLNDADVASYKLEITDLGNSAAAAAVPTVIDDVTVEAGVATAVATNFDKGTYNLRTQLVAYDTDGNEYARSNSNDITVNVTTSGIEGIQTGNEAPAKYFNLQGVEVANPAGGIFIKVEGDKATKVLK